MFKTLSRVVQAFLLLRGENKLINYVLEKKKHYCILIEIYKSLCSKISKYLSWLVSRDDDDNFTITLHKKERDIYVNGYVLKVQLMIIFLFNYCDWTFLFELIETYTRSPLIWVIMQGFFFSTVFKLWLCFSLYTFDRFDGIAFTTEKPRDLFT